MMDWAILGVATGLVIVMIGFAIEETKMLRWRRAEAARPPITFAPFPAPPRISSLYMEHLILKRVEGLDAVFTCTTRMDRKLTLLEGDTLNMTILLNRDEYLHLLAQMLQETASLGSDS